MTLRSVGADGLALALSFLEPGDQSGVDEKSDQQRCHHRRARAEREVTEQPEEGQLVGVRQERQIIQHQPAFSFRASTITAMRLPKEPLTRTVSPGLSAAVSRSTSPAEFSA